MGQLYCFYGSVVEHSPSKRKVRGSIPRGSFFFHSSPWGLPRQPSLHRSGLHCSKMPMMPVIAPQALSARQTFLSSRSGMKLVALTCSKVHRNSPRLPANFIQWRRLVLGAGVSTRVGTQRCPLFCIAQIAAPIAKLEVL